jgi:hypothetical protein
MDFLKEESRERREFETKRNKVLLIGRILLHQEQESVDKGGFIS